MKHTYEIRVDYKDLYGNAVRVVKKCKTKLGANIKYWCCSLSKDVSVSFIKDNKIMKRVIC